MEKPKTYVSSPKDDFGALLDIAKHRGINIAEEVFVKEYLGRKYELHPKENLLQFAVLSFCSTEKGYYSVYDDYVQIVQIEENYKATMSLHVMIIELLTKYIDIREKDKNGCRPFDILLMKHFFNRKDSSKFHHQVFDLLMNKELLDSQYRTENCSYLGKMMKASLWELVDWSLDKGVNTSYNSNTNSSPISMAMSAPELAPASTLRRLLHPSTINMPICVCGSYPLHVAANTKCDAKIELLLLNNADPDVRNPLGLTPLDIYVQKKEIQNRLIIDQLVSSKRGICVQSAFQLIISAIDHPALPDIKCFIREYMNVLTPKHFVYSVHLARTPQNNEPPCYTLLVIGQMAKSKGGLIACSHIRRALTGAHQECSRFEEAMDVLWKCGARPSSFLSYDAKYFNTSDRPEDKSFINKWKDHESSVISLKLLCVHVIRSSMIPVTEQRLEQLTMIPKPLRRMIYLTSVFE